MASYQDPIMDESDSKQLSLVERLLEFHGRYLYKKPLNWTDDHLVHFDCKFTARDKVDNGEPASWEASVDDVQRLATTGDPLAIQNLLNPYIDKPASKEKLYFLFDYDPFGILGKREHRQRFLLDGVSVLAGVPESICYLNLSEVERKREESGGYSNVAQEGSHDPFLAATAIAMAQRLGMERHRPNWSPVCNHCYCYPSHILVAHKQRQYLTVYTTSVANAFMALFDYPFQRPTVCDFDACFKIEFEFDRVDYQPYNTFSARLGGILKNHQAAVQKKLEELEQKELARIQREEEERKRQEIVKEVRRCAEQKREEQKRNEQQLEERRREEQKREELQRELEQCKEQQLEELRRELEQHNEQQLEELRRELEQPQSSAIDDAPAFKRQRRVKATLRRIIRWPVRMSVK